MQFVVVNLVNNLLMKFKFQKVGVKNKFRKYARQRSCLNHEIPIKGYEYDIGFLK
jgi:hypothetical protein